MSDFLKVSNLTKTFKGEKFPSINSIDFELKKGETLALIGPDGAGKTTLIRLISGLLIPDDICSQKSVNSPVLINHLSPYKDLNKVKKIMGYMPQRFGLYEDLTVMENLELYATLKNIPNNKKEKLYKTLLKFANLENFTSRNAGDLSGGMKQKLGLSCTLVATPEILLLDEPTVGVDPISRRELIQITKTLSSENKISVIWATSYLDEAQFFDNVLILNKGKKVYFGKTFYAKKSMMGLSCYIKEKIPDKRIFLDNILQNQPEITDTLLEGEKIRVVFKNKETKEKFPYKTENTEPNFEDFVIHLLGGIKHIELTNQKDIEIDPPNNIALEAIHLSKTYGTFKAVDNISFKVKKGEIFGLLGPNGAGKSTTFKMLCSLIKPTSGSSKIFGLDIQKEPIKAKKIFGYMAQKFSLFGNLSVRQNIDFFKGVYQVEKTTEEIIKGYGLEKYLNTNAMSLPLGYKQRLSLLCALIHNPPVLFLDEPTSGVDPISRREFWIRINNLAKHKTSVIVTTHFMDEAQFCDRIALVYKGKILVIDTPHSLKNSVKNQNLKNPSMEDAFIEIIRRAN